MRNEIVGLTILGVLSYIIFKHFKKPTVPQVSQVEIYNPVEIDLEESKPSMPTIPLQIARGYLPELNPTYTRTDYKAPYDTFGFGMDSSRNTDSIDPDAYLHMPLESEGITHTNEYLYKSIDDKTNEPPKLFKYIRIKFRGLRNSNTLSIGGIRFLMSKVPVKKSVHLWNPHTGVQRVYNGDGLKDSDQMTFVFVFSEPVQLNQYEIKTSLELEDMDPTSWIVEGSRNGSYWIVLDDRKNAVMSLERNKVLIYYMQQIPLSAY